jgi:uncharacterized damage-inducible protein DinB
MSAAPLLLQLFRYQAWADDELLAQMEALDGSQHPEQRTTALRLINHCDVVNQIFAAHLGGKPHGFAADNTVETPALPELRATVAATDRWYLKYLETVTAQQLAESISFRFTDGDQGCMAREEMLAHVITHGVYHRGEVGRIMMQLAIRPPWDTFAVHLHRAEPARRTI